MKTIREIAHEVAEELKYEQPCELQIKALELTISKYLAQQEPVAWLDVSKMTPNGMVYATGFKSKDTQSSVFLAPPIPAGMQLVPVEPTDAMLHAMQSSGWMVGNYKSMLAAAKESSHAE